MSPRRADGPLVVTGATGTVGAPVVRALVAAGADVRAAVRPGGPAVPPGPAEEVPFDWQDEATWRPAFAGAHSVFVVRPPQLGRPRTHMLPALAAAREAGVRHLVLLSLQGAEGNRVVPHATLERWMRGSGVPWTFVRPSFFMQNLTGTHRDEIRDLSTLVVPAGSGRTALVDALDVADVAAAALLDPTEHAGRAWTPTGPEALTYDEVAAVLSAELGREIRYARPGLLRYARHARASGMPWGMVAVTSGIYTVARLGRAGGLTDDVRRLTGRSPRDLRHFVARERAAWSTAGRTTGSSGATMDP
ncbi:NmrA family NAD(P)-binding protein [Aquipuribacter nitratireducens]|uniref:NmrA family NAD(P)-binding protein n=1 Tax=Aquipuribacter nitratireducens TaxID=650104 RepID=UPI0030EBBE13